MGGKLTVWFTGRRKVGKTTMARLIARKINGMYFDGAYILRRGYKFEEMWEHCVGFINTMRAQGHNVAVAFGYVPNELKAEIDERVTRRNSKIVWVLLKSKNGAGEKADFKDADLTIETDRTSISEDVNRVMKYLDENNYYRAGS